MLFDTLPADIGLEVLAESLPMVAAAIAFKKTKHEKYSDQAERAIMHTIDITPLGHSFDQIKALNFDGILLNGVVSLHNVGKEFKKDLSEVVTKAVNKIPDSKVKRSGAWFVANTKIW